MAQAESRKDREEIDISLKYLETTWANIHHNESLRNIFFGGYLTIAGAYIALVEKLSATSNSMALIMMAFFIWAMGILFVWTYIRLKGMIERDSDIASILDAQFLNLYSSLDKVRERRDRYREIFVRKHLRAFGTVSSCVIFGTIFVAAMAPAATMVILRPDDYAAGVLFFISLLLLNWTLSKVVARLWGQ